ncbi:MAG: tRNA pseudouridine(55) synthase TruB [Oscillospiraceae bacterium]|nr:tRNA pseudouridine(55) synthase TruB [Oscillospiraceae bacterium]
MPNGIIIIDKPQDWTSMDVCAKLRGVFHEKRIGHAGTLDPMATGVLPVFVGRATRAVSLAPDDGKEYIAALKLGVVTNTQDIWGEVLEEKPIPTDAQEGLEALLPQFTGEIEQVPPMYSAVKINGKKLYELARKGVEVERKARTVTIHSLTLSPAHTPGTFFLRVRCSKGTYIRTLCHDMGQALGCGGCMASLRRTMACGFTLNDSHTMEEVLNHPDPTSLLLSVDSLFADRPALTLTEKQAQRLFHGGTFSTSTQPGEYRVYSPVGEFLALCRVADGTLSTIKSFFEV